MEVYIERLDKSEGDKCDFCSGEITGYAFTLEKQGREYMVCCVECTAIITGEDTAERVTVRSEYDRRYADFMTTPWNPAFNKLVVTKVWGGHVVSIMRDKFGRRRFGVLLGKAERWNKREKYDRYEPAEASAITDFGTAEIIAFYWIEFVNCCQVAPEEPYSLLAFKNLIEHLLLGIKPTLRHRLPEKWWQQ